ncbi:hypothetical protein AAT19DRAFT_11562 [Rhodotorula toruloides]|uniref:Uncharacterized protein n=1 Tax=Rhodotorula toruloides TaxID=5286 RepID=A0A2S9ZVX4_RHOTO|nr:hypothetical protein AAT19DRAFT_11562 [Rhodotorula toruloides]
MSVLCCLDKIQHEAQRANSAELEEEGAARKRLLTTWWHNRFRLSRVGEASLRSEVGMRNLQGIANRIWSTPLDIELILVRSQPFASQVPAILISGSSHRLASAADRERCFLERTLSSHLDRPAFRFFEQHRKQPTLARSQPASSFRFSRTIRAARPPRRPRDSCTRVAFSSHPSRPTWRDRISSRRLERRPAPCRSGKLRTGRALQLHRHLHRPARVLSASPTARRCVPAAGRPPFAARPGQRRKEEESRLFAT